MKKKEVLFMEYFTAESYTSWERIGEPFYNDKNKLSIRVKQLCPRCGGTGYYATGVENGQLKLHPAYNGICLRCDGKSYEEKVVRLYTKAEMDKMEATKRKNEEKKELDMKAAANLKYAEWLEKNGFSAEGDTYIVTGDSYSIKEELKSVGFRYDSILKWHIAQPGDYIDRCIKVNISEVATKNVFGIVNFNTGAADIIQTKLHANDEVIKSEWIGEIGERVRDIPATIKSIRGFEGMYGYTRIITFVAEEGIITWFTSSCPDVVEGDEVEITATVKDHKEYKGVRQTVVSRAKIIKRV